jgi:tetratricopeptide (TPR) repeat protein
LWSGVVHETLEVSSSRSTFWPSAWIDDYTTALNPRTTRNLELLERAVARGERTPNHLYSLANELRDHERLGMAVATYREFLEVGAGWRRFDALMSLANCQQQLGSVNGARATLLRAIGEDPTRPDGFIALGEMAYAERKWSAAIPFFQAVIGMERPSMGRTIESYYSWFPYDRLAICYGELGRFDDAIASTHRALATCPEVDRLRANLAYFEEQRAIRG